MKLSRERYTELFVPRLSELEQRQLWEAVEARSDELKQARARRQRWIFGVGAAAVLAAAAFLLWPRPSGVVVAGRILQAPERATQELVLPDGSKVQLEARAQLRVESFSAENARLVLTRGGAWFDVTHRASRSFIVQAGGVEVAVLGTRFHVSLVGLERAAARRVDVQVERGSVEVRRSSATPPVTLEPGERWTSALGVAARSAHQQSTPLAQAAPEPSTQSLSSTAVPSAAVSAHAPAATASSVFDAANKARVAGRSRDAAALFDQLRRQYRGDARAALAALQLGRIRLDELGDLDGAIEALRDALALGGGGSLRDDAQARLVEAYERSGNLAACRRAKQTYLAGQPRGAHRSAVEQRCRK